MNCRRCTYLGAYKKQKSNLKFKTYETDDLVKL